MRLNLLLTTPYASLFKWSLYYYLLKKYFPSLSTVGSPLATYFAKCFITPVYCVSTLWLGITLHFREVLLYVLKGWIIIKVWEDCPLGLSKAIKIQQSSRKERFIYHKRLFPPLFYTSLYSCWLHEPVSANFAGVERPRLLKHFVYWPAKGHFFQWLSLSPLLHNLIIDA